jgi:hypothetical protein
VIDGGRRPGETHPVAPAELVDQAQDRTVAGEPVVIVALDRPFPAGFAKAGRQAADMILGLEDDHLVTGAGQVVGRC